MQYHLLLSSGQPVDDPGIRTSSKIKSAPANVLEDAKLLVRLRRRDRLIANHFKEAVRVYYHTRVGYVAIFFVRVDHDDVGETQTLLNERGMVQDVSFAVVADGGPIHGDNYDVELENADAERLLVTMGLTVCPPNQLSLVSPPSASEPRFRFGLVDLVPPHEDWDQRAIIRDYDDAITWFKHDFGARFVIVGSYNRKDCKRAKAVWKQICRVSNLQYDSSHIPTRTFICTAAGSVVFSPQLIRRVPPMVLKKWSSNEYSSCFFPANGILFSGFIRPFCTDDASLFIDRSSLGPLETMLQSPSYRLYTSIHEQFSTFVLHYPVKGFYETFPLVYRTNISATRNYYLPVDEIASSCLIILRYYLDQPELLARMDAASYNGDNLAVLSLARVINDLLPLRPLPSLTEAANIEVINHVMGYAYQRIVIARRNEGLLNSGRRDTTYGELESSLLERFVGAHGLTSHDNIVDIGCGIGLISLYYSLRFGKPPLGIELRSDLEPLAHDMETLVEYSARRWSFKMLIPRRIIDNVLTNTECKEALQEATFVIINNFKFDPRTNEDIARLLVDLGGRRVIVTTGPLPLPSCYRQSMEYFNDAVTWTSNPVCIYSYSNK